MQKLITIGHYQSLNAEAKVIFEFNKSLIAITNKQFTNSSCEVLENIVLQLLNALAPKEGLIYLFENNTSHNFSQLKYLFASTENQIGKQFYAPREINGFVKDINVTLSQRYALFASAGVKDIESYNQKQRIKLPYFFIVLSGLATMVQQDNELIHILRNITEQGSSAGIFLIINHDIDSTKKLDLPPQYSKNFYNFLMDISINIQGFNFFEPLIPFNNPPQYQKFLKDFGYKVLFKANFATSITQNILKQREALDANSTKQDFLKIKIGTAKAKDTFFTMGDATFAFHTMISGGTGSGKTTFTQNLVLGMCEKYSSEALQLLLLDFGQVSFSPYKSVAHVPYLFNNPNNDEEIILLFEFIHHEIHRRKELFKQYGIEHEMILDNIHSYMKHTKTTLPRFVIMIDEFARLMKNKNYVTIGDKEYRVNSYVTTILNEISAEGRKAGMHLVMITQSFYSVDMPDEVKANTAMRVALKAEMIQDSKATLNQDNESAYYIAPYQAVLNSKAGKVEGNLLVDLDFVSEDELIQRQKVLRQKYPKNSKSDVEYYLQNAKAKKEKQEVRRNQNESSSGKDNNQHWASKF
ncbi:MAG: hypothetical protein KN64_06570 [Sulfurovum sp. AS07-7]|nr:MAG: hypothetical protein KN64_06570 [Sulfurovum sp. AS07-7]